MHTYIFHLHIAFISNFIAIHESYVTPDIRRAERLSGVTSPAALLSVIKSIMPAQITDALMQQLVARAPLQGVGVGDGFGGDVSPPTFPVFSHYKFRISSNIIGNPKLWLKINKCVEIMHN